MRPTSVTVSSASASPWIPIDTSLNGFGAALNVDLNSTTSGITYSVQHTFDPLGKEVTATLSRSTTTVTLTFSEAHNLNTGDSVTVLNANHLANASGLDGTYDVTVTSATACTYTSGTSGTVASTNGVKVVALRVQTTSGFSSLNVSADGNYTFAPTACRLILTAWTAGSATLTVIQGRK